MRLVQQCTVDLNAFYYKTNENYECQMHFTGLIRVHPGKAVQDQSKKITKCCNQSLSGHLFISFSIYH